METKARATNTKRYVIEDSFTKVTSDGEPHEMLTMIAGVSGLITAIVILAILVTIISYKGKERSSMNSCKNCKSLLNSSSNIRKNNGKLSSKYIRNAAAGLNGKRSSSILSILRRASSIAEDAIAEEPESCPRLISIATITHGNLEGNLNMAFMADNELKLNGHSSKILTPSSNIAETSIDVPKY